MTQRDEATSSPEVVFGRDLAAFAPVLEGWAKRAHQLGIYGLEQTLRKAALSAASWARALKEEES